MGDRVQVPSVDKNGNPDQSDDWDYISPEGSPEREAAEAYHEDQLETQRLSAEDEEFRGAVASADPSDEPGDVAEVAALVPDEAVERPAAGAPDKPVDDEVREVPAPVEPVDDEA